jgi:hypothetical protein
VETRAQQPLFLGTSGVLNEVFKLPRPKNVGICGCLMHDSMSPLPFTYPKGTSVVYLDSVFFLTQWPLMNVL